MPTDIIYDEETFPNVFTLSAKEAGTGNRWQFEFSHRINQLEALFAWVRWLQYTGARMVGFNNLGFDYPVLHQILITPGITPDQIYQFAIGIINSEDRFTNVIWDRDQLVPQVDLYKIHHFDNQAKSTSLKELEFNMRRQRVVDLPFKPGTILTDDQIRVLLAYNDEDVDATEAFYFESLEAIRFREDLSEKYGKNFVNFNNGKIGESILIDALETSNPGICYTTDESGRRKPRQTWRAQISLNDAVFPWINFKRPEFTAVMHWFQKQIISETKGVFSDIPEPTLGELAQWCATRKKRGHEIAIAENLNVVVNGFRFDFGTGGIHGSVSSQIVSSDEHYEIIDLDVTSYYPSLGIVNRIYPAHLSERFCDIYAGIKTDRKAHKKGTPLNLALKEALNVAYGKSNSLYSPFYDPLYTMAITINGQLLLCLLADYLMDIPGLQLIQINTDGVTVRCPRCQRDRLKVICDWWQAHTLLDLEEATYSRMMIRDVNNYIAEYSKGGKLKRKGAYEWLPVDQGGTLGWHQNHSALVIPKAAEAALVEGIPVADFILNHDDIFDFMLRAKIPRTSRLVLKNGATEEEMPHICRYYVSKTGGSLVKIMPPLAKNPDKERRISIDAGWLVTPCNDIADAKGIDIDFNYYILEAEKLVKPLMERST